MKFTPLTHREAGIGADRARRAVYYLENRVRIIAAVAARYDPEKKSIYDRNYRLAHHDEKITRDRLYNAANRDRSIARSKARRIAKPGEAKASINKWKSAHAEQVNAHNANRRARKNNASGTHTAKDMAILLVIQRGKCAHSWCRIGLTVSNRHKDHRIPLKLGGSNDRCNMQWLCAPCNLKKAAKHPITIAQEFGLLL